MAEKYRIPLPAEEISNNLQKVSALEKATDTNKKEIEKRSVFNVLITDDNTSNKSAKDIITAFRTGATIIVDNYQPIKILIVNENAITLDCLFDKIRSDGDGQLTITRYAIKGTAVTVLTFKTNILNSGNGTKFLNDRGEYTKIDIPEVPVEFSNSLIDFLKSAPLSDFNTIGLKGFKTNSLDAISIGYAISAHYDNENRPVVTGIEQLILTDNYFKLTLASVKELQPSNYLYRRAYLRIPIVADSEDSTKFLNAAGEYKEIMPTTILKYDTSNLTITPEWNNRYVIEPADDTTLASITIEEPARAYSNSYEKTIIIEFDSNDDSEENIVFNLPANFRWSGPEPEIYPQKHYIITVKLWVDKTGYMYLLGKIDFYNLTTGG